MKIKLIIALAVFTLNSSDGISQGFEKKYGNPDGSFFNKYQHEANMILNNGFTGIFNSVYFPGKGAKNSVFNSQACTGNFSEKYEVAWNKTGVISGRIETITDSTQGTLSLSRKRKSSKNEMKTKSNKIVPEANKYFLEQD